MENISKKKERGEWSIKAFIPSCECCGEIECDRMKQKSDLDDMIQDLKYDVNLEYNARYKIYRVLVRFKYGSLGRGDRREINECVRMLIVSSFPPPLGTDLTGFSIE